MSELKNNIEETLKLLEDRILNPDFDSSQIDVGKLQQIGFAYYCNLLARNTTKVMLQAIQHGEKEENESN